MIKKLAIPLSLAVAATLAACAGTGTHETVVTGSTQTGFVASAVAVQSSGTVRPGAGKVALLTDLAGPVADISNQTVTVNMKDGTTQTIYVHGEQLMMGDSIRIGSDNSIKR